MSRTFVLETAESLFRIHVKTEADKSNATWSKSSSRAKVIWLMIEGLHRRRRGNGYNDVSL
jgi:hypothetical protein